MAKRVEPAEVNNTPTILVLSKSEFKTGLDDRIALGEELLNRRVLTQEEFAKNKEDYHIWNDYNSEYLKQAFNNENNEYKNSYDDEGTFFFVSGSRTSETEKLKEFKDKISSKISHLKKLLAKINLLKSSFGATSSSKATIVGANKSQVFIVHGHDEAAENKAARFIEKLGLAPIILHEQASGSMTVIEKIEEYSNVGFGIVLYTPCDIGAKDEVEPNLRKRARQNVVFEHGFLIGKIGRKNVCALVKDDLEIPNDISGVVYVKMDSEDAWQLKVARELRNSGYSIDMNDL